MIGRRVALAGALAGTVVRSRSALGDGAVGHEAGGAPSDATLRALAARSGLLFGTSAQVDQLAADPAYAALVAREAGQLTGENELKWHRLRPGPDRFDWAPAERLFAFADAHGMPVRGHTLVWHENLPDWLDPVGRSGDLAGTLDRHIDVVVGRYAGRIPWWDVVNEPVLVEDGAPDGLRRSMFRERLGPDYVADALRRARAADPGCRLAINEYDVEFPGDYFERRRRALLALLRRVRDVGAPLDVVGIQSHLKWTPSGFDPGLFAGFLREVAAFGVTIHLTEFDVGDRALPAAIAPRDAAVAALTRDYLAVALAEPAVTLLTAWDLTDRYSWLSVSPFVRRDDGLRSRGCPYDAAFQPKPMRAALAAALGEAATRRG